VSNPVLEVTTEDSVHTEAIGAALANWLREGDVVLLHGDLGAGKTTLAKGIAQALRIDAVVSSPSFALVNEYDGGLLAPVTKLYHLDLYRLHVVEELASIGFEDYIAPTDGVTLIEWPERAAEVLPDRYLLIEFTAIGENRRRLRITPTPVDDAWTQRFADLRDRLTQQTTDHGTYQGQ
jgi:tRNA threonylcarbamoyladenosine biosynthesis protein TsaE